MVTSLSTNSHLPHVQFTGCRFLRSNFIAGQLLHRISSLMRLCTVVRSHGSCNVLRHLRDQIHTASNQLILYWVSEHTIWLRRFSTIPGISLPFESFSAWKHLLSRPTLMSVPGLPSTYKFFRLRLLIWNPWNVLCLGSMKFLCLPGTDLYSTTYVTAIVLIYQGF